MKKQIKNGEAEALFAKKQFTGSRGMGKAEGIWEFGIYRGRNYWG